MNHNSTGTAKFSWLSRTVAHSRAVQYVGVLAIFGIIGTILLVSSHASTPTATIEPENGTLSGAASLLSDSSAAGGKSIKFNASTGSTPPPAGGSLVFDDEFNGSSVDTSKWTVWNNTTLSYDAGYITSRPQNLFEQNGVLTERAQKENLGGRSYTEAYINTIGKQNFGVGYRYELRARTPTQPNTSAGMWPAYWLRSNETPAEIDIAEWYGNPQPADTRAKFNKFTITIHQNTSGTNESRAGYDVFFPGNAAPWDGFHTYAVDVKSDGYYFYLDGTFVKSMLVKDYPWMQDGLNGTWNIRLNMQVGLSTKWSGAPDANTAFPGDFQFDYMRVYKLP